MPAEASPRGRLEPVRRAGAPRGADPAAEPAGAPTWEEALALLERHVAEIRTGLEHSAAMPEPYRVPLPDAPLPAGLEGRARRILAEQRDLEVAIRERMGIISGAMHRDPHLRRAMISLYLDTGA